MTNVWGHESEKRGRETHTAAAAAAAAFVRFVAIQPADGTATTRRQCVTWLRRGERKGDRFFSSAAPFVWELLPGTVTHNKHAPTSWRHHLCGESPMPLFFSLLLNTSSQRLSFPVSHNSHLFQFCIVMCVWATSCLVGPSCFVWQDGGLNCWYVIRVRFYILRSGVEFLNTRAVWKRESPARARGNRT